MGILFKFLLFWEAKETRIRKHLRDKISILTFRRIRLIYTYVTGAFKYFFSMLSQILDPSLIATLGSILDSQLI